MIRVTRLNKSFGKLDVLRDISVDLREGRVTAVMGPNAAGKTTLIKCILGLVKADEGVIDVRGTRVDGDHRYREQIGYMPQSGHFPENLTGAEIIGFLRRLRADQDALPDESLIHLLGLASELTKPVRDLSGGTRQKLSAAIAFLFDPPILILDEPTAGLDPRSSSTLKDKILEARAAGKTVVLTSHIMSEVDELADYVVFLDGGHIIFEGEANELRSATGEQRIERALARMMEGMAA